MSNAVCTIRIRAARFFAHHGLYREERKVANEFVVDLDVDLNPTVDVIVKMDETINYIKLYELVKKFMLSPTDLIETIAMNITEAIHGNFPAAKRVSITITKKYPPVINFSGNVAVTFQKEF
jgi:dihydroneopterin aldolase